jgi:hypothetical protein
MSSVIVLTKTYAYWGERSLEDAIRLYFRGKAEILKADESRLIKAGINKNGIILKMPAPLILRLLEFTGIYHTKTKIKYSKEAVWKRDDNYCQFWHRDEKGKKFKYKCSQDDRTIDHLIPKSRGGKRNDFLNCVTACRHCNEKIKGNKTPLEAGLILTKLPEIPKFRRGDMIILTFSFNPSNKAHQALRELIPQLIKL